MTKKQPPTEANAEQSVPQIDGDMAEPQIETDADNPAMEPDAVSVAPLLQTPASGYRVIALVAFGDAKPTRSYSPGDEVIGWSRERAEHYAVQRLVEIVEG